MCPGGSQTLGTSSAFDGNQSHGQHRPRFRRTMNSDTALGFSLILEDTSCSSGPPSLYGLSIKLILKEQKWPQMSLSLTQPLVKTGPMTVNPEPAHSRSMEEDFVPGSSLGPPLSPHFSCSARLCLQQHLLLLYLGRLLLGDFFFLHDAFS